MWPALKCKWETVGCGDCCWRDSRKKHVGMHILVLCMKAGQVSCCRTFRRPAGKLLHRSPLISSTGVNRMFSCWENFELVMGLADDKGTEETFVYLNASQ